MPLTELRKAVGLTQAELAETLDVGQGSVSKIENATDMYLSTLRRFVAALGGDLVIKASFPGGREFEISQFSTLLERAGSPERDRTEKRRKRSA
jgi:transcriptional regulator with XRE-family HTH domain